MNATLEAFAYRQTAQTLRDEPIEERIYIFDWQVYQSISNLQNQVNALKNHMVALRQENEKLRDIIQELKPETFREEKVDLNINWSLVRSAIRSAASELNWNIEIVIDEDENLIIVLLKEDQDDMIAETEFDFYSLTAKQLEKEIFKAINFHFVPDYD